MPQDESHTGRFDKEANEAALRAARLGKGKWFDFRPDLPDYARRSGEGAAVVDAIVESFCQRSLLFTVDHIIESSQGVRLKRGGELKGRKSIQSQLSDLFHDEYILRRRQGEYERFPTTVLDEFSGGWPHPAGTPSSATKRRRQADENRLEVLEQQLERGEDFDPNNIQDARQRVLASIVRRRGRHRFRKQLLDAYERQCAITRCSVEEILEAAHIMAYKGDYTDHPQTERFVASSGHSHTLRSRTNRHRTRQTNPCVWSSRMNCENHATGLLPEVQSWFPMSQNCTPTTRL